MPDVFTTEKRSQVMSKIRGRGNRDTEIALIDLMRTHGITGWRRNVAIFGKPDFVFSKHRLVIFVDGCFWHQCPKHSNIPANNREFWIKKLNANIVRDKLVNRTLRARGWRVLRVWEHELSRRNHSQLVRRIVKALGTLNKEIQIRGFKIPFVKSDDRF